MTSRANYDLRNTYAMVKRYYDQQTLGELTASKCKAKTAFTKAKHELIRVVKQSPSQREIQSLLSHFDECKRNVLAIQTKLASEYKKSEYKQCWKNTVKETESINAEYEETRKMAESYLGRGMSGVMRRSSENLTSGPDDFVTEDECTEIRINDGTIQDLDLNFGKLDALDLVKDERRRTVAAEDYTSFQTRQNFKTFESKQSSDDSVFEDDLKFLREGRRLPFQRSAPFTQSMREIRTTDRKMKQSMDSYASELSEEERRMKNRRKKVMDAPHISQSSTTATRGLRERTLSWDSSTVEDEKRSRELRRLRATPVFEKVKHDSFRKSRNRLSGDLSEYKSLSQDWSGIGNGFGNGVSDSPYSMKGVQHYQEPPMMSRYLEKETNEHSESRTSFSQSTPLRRSLRKHVSFSGFDLDKDPYRESLRSPKRTDLDLRSQSLITVIENTKSFAKYNKLRIRLQEMLDSPMPRRNKVKELQELMRAAYNKLQDDIFLLSEEYKRDIKRHESEMMSAYNMSRSYLERKDSQSRTSASSTSIGDFSLKDLPRKKGLRKSLTTDDLLVKFR